MGSCLSFVERRHSLLHQRHCTIRSKWKDLVLVSSTSHRASPLASISIGCVGRQQQATGCRRVHTKAPLDCGKMGAAQRQKRAGFPLTVLISLLAGVFQSESSTMATAYGFASVTLRGLGRLPLSSTYGTESTFQQVWEVRKLLLVLLPGPERILRNTVSISGASVVTTRTQTAITWHWLRRLVIPSGRVRQRPQVTSQRAHWSS
mmetsp:Transcript_14548/g.34199  ORF Transcript_14548/g.34199 Transcript_14548/m.34199 type:complete len:205 (+) Transcript_14548:1024-1638(+)